jgi:hypothetical protein
MVDTFIFWDVRSSHDQRHPDAVIKHTLFSQKPMFSNGQAVIAGEKDIGIVGLARSLQCV